MSSSKSDMPNPTNFDKFIPWAGKEFNVDVDIVITKATQKPYESITSVEPQHTRKLSKKTKTAKELFVARSVSDSDNMPSVSIDKAVTCSANIVRIETIYDRHDNLVELKFLKNKAILRKVMQIIALTLPYQKHLRVITINGGLRMDSLYEISKFLPTSHITELCFDGTFLNQANYHILLTHSKLKHLSLARCSINDAVVKTITDQLKDPYPAARVLSALNLSTNKITDIGAKYIADMLRTNRQLSYLNLAANMITDEGGVSILDTLQKFPMLASEVLEGRAAYVGYLKKRKHLIKTLIKGLETAAFDENSIKKKTIKKGKMESHSMQNIGLKKQHTEAGTEAQILQERAECLADNKMGLFNEPFSPNHTKTEDGVIYCLGNNILCCLNFAYNNLTYASLKKLCEVLSTQHSLNRIPRGLCKVVIEGNIMPVFCEEYEDINHLLLSNLVCISKHESVSKRKTLSAKSTIIHRSVK